MVTRTIELGRKVDFIGTNPAPRYIRAPRSQSAKCTLQRIALDARSATALCSCGCTDVRQRCVNERIARATTRRRCLNVTQPKKVSVIDATHRNRYEKSGVSPF